MNTHTIIVTIGRNRGDVPMTSNQWSKFKMHVGCALIDAGFTLIQRPELEGTSQVGEWCGVREDAAVFVCLAHSANTERPRSRLRGIATEYGQDAIGYIVVGGTNHLIIADPHYGGDL